MAPAAEFFKKYQSKAGAEGVDPLGYYLGGWGYAYLRCSAQAIERRQEPRRRQDRRLLPQEHVQDHHRRLKFGPSGEWTKSGMMQVQYHGIKRSGLETWRGMDYQTVLTPGRSEDRQPDLSVREGEVGGRKGLLREHCLVC